MSAGGKSGPVAGGQQPGGLYQARPDMGPNVGFGAGLPNTGSNMPQMPSTPGGKGNATGPISGLTDTAGQVGDVMFDAMRQNQDPNVAGLGNFFGTLTGQAVNPVIGQMSRTMDQSMTPTQPMGAGQAANTGPLNAGPNMPAMPGTPGGKSSPKYDIFRDPYTVLRDEAWRGLGSQQPTNPAITNPNVSIGMPVQQQPVNRFVPPNAPGRRVIQPGWSVRPRVRPRLV